MVLLGRLSGRVGRCRDYFRCSHPGGAPAGPFPSPKRRGDGPSVFCLSSRSARVFAREAPAPVPLCRRAGLAKFAERAEGARSCRAWARSSRTSRGDARGAALAKGAQPFAWSDRSSRGATPAPGDSEARSTRINCREGSARAIVCAVQRELPRAERGVARSRGRCRSPTTGLRWGRTRCTRSCASCRISRGFSRFVARSVQVPYRATVCDKAATIPTIVGQLF